MPDDSINGKEAGQTSWLSPDLFVKASLTSFMIALFSTTVAIYVRNMIYHQTISSTINNFFSEIGEHLANNFSNVNNSEHGKFLGNQVSYSMVLYQITENYIKNT